jgi:hypothetical protein
MQVGLAERIGGREGQEKQKPTQLAAAFVMIPLVITIALIITLALTAALILASEIFLTRFPIRVIQYSIENSLKLGFNSWPRVFI